MISQNAGKAKKKPVEVEILLYTGENIEEVAKFLGYEPVETFGGFTIETLESSVKHQVSHYVSEGDVVIKGVQGEFYACKPDIFEQTYEVVE